MHLADHMLLSLPAMRLQEVNDRAMTDAALGVDTNHPGGASALCTGLDFERQRYEAVDTTVIR